MSTFDAWAFDSQWLNVLPNDVQTNFMGTLPPSGVTVVARLDGATMLDSDDVFRQFSEELRFPSYFGWNWDALSDCLRDLSWRLADRYLVVLEGADQVLLGSFEERVLLFETLVDAAKSWANPLGKPGNLGVLFKVVMFCADEAVCGLRAEVARY